MNTQTMEIYIVAFSFINREKLTCHNEVMVEAANVEAAKKEAKKVCRKEHAIHNITITSVR